MLIAGEYVGENGPYVLVFMYATGRPLLCLLLYRLYV